MEINLKDLTEFAAEFLKLKKNNDTYECYYVQLCQENYYIGFDDFFEHPVFAPYLMHLGKREMLDDVMHFTEIYGGNKITVGENKNIYWYEIVRHPQVKIFKAEHDNEFIAFWSAVEQAVGGGE